MYCEIPDVYREKLVTARKSHTCCETGKTIHPGEKYWYCFGIWDGEVKTYKQCEAAYHFARKLNNHLDIDNIDECYVGFGDINSFFIDHKEDCPEFYQEWEKIKNESS